MADSTAPFPRQSGKTSIAARRKQPAKPIRTHSESDTIHHEAGSDPPSRHTRHKSTSLASGATRGSTTAGRRGSEQASQAQPHGFQSPRIPDSIPEHSPLPSGLLSPPMTPVKSRDRASSGKSDAEPGIITYDFSKLDYELERAKVIGKGLWSVVLLADGKVHSPPSTCRKPLSPPATPESKSQFAPSSMYAVKTPARQDAKDVFKQEAKVLSHLMRLRGATQYVVPFFGMDLRNSALVFEAVIGGSLESLNNRLRQVTEVSRHLELVNIFPGLSDDLINGLEFIHSARIVHADIKPANVLLDMSEHYSLPGPVIRARYIDFSAAFRQGTDDSTANAGGTWDYMAPEQMRIQKDFSTPTPASDVWSLGITLLFLIAGSSPYTAICGDNMFMTREAIKSGDPLGFARADPKAQKRMAACQDFIDCCRVALKKDRANRVSAATWKDHLPG